jgi:hypothetical protein
MTPSVVIATAVYVADAAVSNVLSPLMNELLASSKMRLTLGRFSASALRTSDVTMLTAVACGMNHY